MPAAVTQSSGPTIRQECLGYDSTVTLAGTLRRETHPGPPGFESVENGDQAQTGFYLHLSQSVCTNENQAVPDGAAEDSVRRVQLVLDSAGYAALSPFVDRQITVAGTLFSSFTGHHHAPLLLSDVSRVP